MHGGHWLLATQRGCPQWRASSCCMAACCNRWRRCCITCLRHLYPGGAKSLHYIHYHASAINCKTPHVRRLVVYTPACLVAVCVHVRHASSVCTVCMYACLCPCLGARAQTCRPLLGRLQECVQWKSGPHRSHTTHHRRPSPPASLVSVCYVSRLQLMCVRLSSLSGSCRAHAARAGSVAGRAGARVSPPPEVVGTPPPSTRPLPAAQPVRHRGLQSSSSSRSLSCIQHLLISSRPSRVCRHRRHITRVLSCYLPACCQLPINNVNHREEKTPATNLQLARTPTTNKFCAHKNNLQACKAPEAGSAALAGHGIAPRAPRMCVRAHARVAPSVPTTPKPLRPGASNRRAVGRRQPASRPRRWRRSSRAQPLKPRVNAGVCQVPLGRRHEPLPFTRLLLLAVAADAASSWLAAPPRSSRRPVARYSRSAAGAGTAGQVGAQPDAVDARPRRRDVRVG